MQFAGAVGRLHDHGAEGGDRYASADFDGAGGSLNVLFNLPAPLICGAFGLVHAAHKTGHLSNEVDRERTK